MSAHHAGYVVTLAEDIFDEDAEQVLAALRMIRGVVAVEPVNGSVEVAIAEDLHDANRIAREQAERWKAEQAARAEAEYWGEASREMIANMTERRERQTAERLAEIRRVYGGAEER